MKKKILLSLLGFAILNGAFSIYSFIQSGNWWIGPVIVTAFLFVVFSLWWIAIKIFLED